MTLFDGKRHTDKAFAGAMIGACAMFGAFAANASPDVREHGSFLVEQHESAVEWLPAVVDTRYKLTVNGPEAYRLEETFAPGEVPRIDLKGAGLADGTYTWEISQIQPAASDEQSVSGMEKGHAAVPRSFEPVQKASGSFNVRSGSLVPNSAELEEQPQHQAKSRIGLKADTPEETFTRACVGNGCDPTPESYSSVAGDTARLMVKQNNNRMLFLDNSSPSGDFPGVDWGFIFNDSNSGGANHFTIQDRGPENDQDRRPFRIDAGAFTDSLRATPRTEFVLSCDISGCTLIPVGEVGVGIGTATPGRELHIKAQNSTSGIRLEDAGDRFFDQSVGSTGLLFSSSETSGTAVQFRHDAPANSLVVRGSGIGMGTNSPDAALHVRRSDGTAKLFVHETGATSGVSDLFELRNPGQVKFVITDSSSGRTWDFSNRNNGFNINLLGTGGQEFLIRNNGEFVVGPGGTENFKVEANGDVYVTGTLVHSSSRTVKEAITPVDGNVVLEKLGQLDVAEWSYKKDGESKRHLSPMAEDFHAAFGLGPDGKHVAPSDLAGVALAAAKALKSENESLKSENQDLRTRLERIESRLGLTAK